MHSSSAVRRDARCNLAATLFTSMSLMAIQPGERAQCLGLCPSGSLSLSNTASLSTSLPRSLPLSLALSNTASLSTSLPRSLPLSRSLQHGLSVSLALVQIDLPQQHNLLAVIPPFVVHALLVLTMECPLRACVHGERYNPRDNQSGFAGIPREMTGIAMLLRDKASYQTYMVRKGGGGGL